MIAVLKSGTNDKQIDNLSSWLKAQGLDVHISKGSEHTVIGLIALALEVLLFTTNIPGIAKYSLMVLLLAVAIWLYMPFDGQRFYMMFVNLAKYVFSVKKYSKEYTKANASIDNFIAFKDIKDGFIVYNEYYAGVLEIDPREFRLLSGYKQDQIIDVHFGKVIRSISGNTKASIVKIDRKMMLDKYIEAEREKERQRRREQKTF